MKIAVIVPCRNEVKNIEECINAIYNSNLPPNWEIHTYVVDGKSDDGTIQLLDALKAQYPTLHCVVNEQQLTPFAFNLGIYEAGSCDFYQIVGARQVISENYISEAAKTMIEDPEIWCVGGAVQNVYLNNVGEIIAAAMATTLGMGIGNFRTLHESTFVDTVGTPMYPKHVFEKIGYFDELLIRNQDDDFNFRVLKAGGKILFHAGIKVKYYVRGSYSGLRKQFFQYGYWKVYVNTKHKTVTTIRQLVPPIFVLYSVIWALSSLLGLTSLMLASIPFVMYFILVGYFSLKEKTEKIPFLSLAKTFPMLHFSYGLGYLRGLFDFVFLKKKPSEKQKSLSR